MKVYEAISLVDDLKPNQYTETRKIQWLSRLDGQIFTEVFQTHEGSSIDSFTGYDDDSQNEELLVPYPYDEDIYSYFLQAQIDRANGESAKYNQTITMYNNAFLAFQNWYNRTHLPLAKWKRFVF